MNSTVHTQVTRAQPQRAFPVTPSAQASLRDHGPLTTDPLTTLESLTKGWHLQNGVSSRRPLSLPCRERCPAPCGHVLFLTLSSDFAVGLHPLAHVICCPGPQAGSRFSHYIKCSRGHLWKCAPIDPGLCGLHRVYKGLGATEWDPSTCC